MSDSLRVTGQGLKTLERVRIREDLERLKELAEAQEVCLLLIGKPLHMSGDESRQSEYTREFAERLSTHTGLPIVYWDERLTSAEAERLLKASGTSLAGRKRGLDRLAAEVLLESYLGY